jgi:hypothetical protein
MPEFHVAFRDLLHAVNLRHGTHSFTSLPKDGVMRIFLALKIRRLRPGLNPRTWVLKASTLPLEHRSRLYSVMQLRHHSFTMITKFGLYSSNHQIVHYLELEQKLYNRLSGKTEKDLSRSLERNLRKRLKHYKNGPDWRPKILNIVNYWWCSCMTVCSTNIIHAQLRLTH